MSTLNNDEEWDVTNCELAPEYRARFIKDLYNSARSQGQALPDGLLISMTQAFESGMNAGGNMIYRIIASGGRVRRNV